MFLFFFFFFNLNSENVEFFCKWIETRAGNKGKRQIISLWTSLVFIKTKQQLFVAKLQTWLCPFPPSQLFSGISFVVPEEVTLSHLLLCLSSKASYIELWISNTQICSFLEKYSSSKVLMRKFFVWTSDLEYLILIPIKGKTTSD